MFINVIDVVIILLLLAGIIIGYKKGAIQMLAYIIGTVGIIIISWYLKNPLAIFMYKHFPYFNNNTIFKNVYVINILIYQVLAFIIILSIFFILLGIVLKFTGLISKIVNKSIILTFPSRLIGMLLGFLESYIFIFILLFIISQFSISYEVLNSSKYSDVILQKTPLTNEFRNSYKAFNKIKDISKDKKNDNKNNESLNVLLKYKIITPKVMNNLVKYGKIKKEDVIDLIERG